MNLKFNIFNAFYMTISTLITLISASDGDERPSFLNCLKNCPSNFCELDRILKWTGWNCSNDCKYKCMRLDLKGMRELNERIVQYYGKWPFLRVFGAQEIFSVIFSLGNLMACVYGYFIIYKKKKKEKAEEEEGESRIQYMGTVHLIGLLITCNTWLQSAIFHYRDTPFTEKLDYFSACLFIISTVPVALIRIFEVKSGENQLKLFLPFLILYFQHIFYMSFIKFDYGYNVKFNAIFGISSNLIWILWAIFKQKDKKLKWETLKFVGGNFLSMAMVAVDFPPFFDLIDTHALWHLSTIPITIMWYKFISIDDERSRTLKEE